MNSLIINQLAFIFPSISKLIQSCIYLGVTVFLIWLGLAIFSFATKINIKKLLIEEKKFAILISASGFLFGLGYIFSNIHNETSTQSFSGDLFDTFLWSFISLLLLFLSQKISDKFIFPKFSNIKELTKDNNIGLGIAEGCSFIATSQILYASIAGESNYFLSDLKNALIYFVACQIIFIFISKVWDFFTKINIHPELERDNPAVGIWLGFRFIALGYLLSQVIMNTDQLFIFIVWSFTLTIILAIVEFVVDKLILTNLSISKEIGKNQNWGVALLIGTINLITTFIISAIVL